MRRGIITFFLSVCIFGTVLFVSVKPLFHPGLFPTIDNISVVRLQAMVDELQMNRPPLRHVTQLGKGHGYMLYGYYAPLPFYVGAAMNSIGTNLVGALKRSYLLAVLLGSIGIFGLAYELFGVYAALISVTAYALSPFLGYDLYWRGGLGEVWAMGCFSWVLWFSFRAIRNSSWLDAIIAGLSISGLMLSHNLTAYMGMIFVAVWIVLWSMKYKKGHLEALTACVLGFGMSAFFWFPAFVTRMSVWVSYLQADRSQIFESLLHGRIEDILFPVFIPMVLNWTAILFPIVAWWYAWKKAPSDIGRYAAHATGLLFVAALFFMTGASRSTWDVFFPVLYIFQYPWRFLTMATVFGSLLTGGIIYVSSRFQWGFVALMIIVFTYVNLPNFRPLSYEFVDIYRPQDPCGTSWGFEYFPTWVRTCLKTSWESPYRITSGDPVITVVENRPRFIFLHVIAKRESVVQIGQYAYPGWQAHLDGRLISISHENDNGLVELVIPEGTHDVSVILKNTPIEQWSNTISVLSGTFVLIEVILGLSFRPRIHKTKFKKV